MPRVVVEQKLGATYRGMIIEEFDLNQDHPYRSIIFARAGIMESAFATKTEAAMHQWKWINWEIHRRVTDRSMGREQGQKVLDEAQQALGVVVMPTGESQS